MALTNTIVFDVINGTQTITFYNPTQVDQITYNNNQITFQSASTYNLVKSDLLLYFKFINLFLVSLEVNFPAFNQSTLNKWPLCQFDITESSSGVTHLIYNQNSGGSNVININYVPIAGSAGFAGRSSPITISAQEFFMTTIMYTQYSNQVVLN